MLTMRRGHIRLYDSLLTVSALYLLYLYTVDPYHRLAPTHTPAIKPNPKDDQVSIIKSPNNIENPDEAKPPKDAVIPETPDLRSVECRSKPRSITTQASIVVTVPQVAFLAPTLNSLVKFTPRQLIYELLLVDHGDLSAVHAAEMARIAKEGGTNATVVKHTEKGHVAARHKAAAAAEGRVLVFLEAGSLVSPGWLEPLLEVLQTERHAVVIPRLDKVNDELTFGYIPVAELQLPVIDRDLTITMAPTGEKEGATDIIPVGAMRREIFATSTDYWRSMGGLDRQVGDAGGVHQEMALRLWQCGGSIHMAQCSRVAILAYDIPMRIHMPLNAWKLDRMWISSDEWKPSKYRPDWPKTISATEIKFVDDKMKIIREKHHCKEDIKDYFKTFVPKTTSYSLVATRQDLLFQTRFRAIVPRNDGKTAGYLRSVATKQCVYPDHDRTLVLGACDPSVAGVPAANMTFRLMPGGKIKDRYDRCITVAQYNYMKIMDCDNMNEMWNYWEQQKFEWHDDKQLVFWYGRVECVFTTFDPKKKRPLVKVLPCDLDHGKGSSKMEMLVPK